MKDKQGVTRGKCTISECECTEYLKPQDSSGVRCDYCDHAPAKHAKTIKLGACTKCNDCPSYDSEDSGSYPDCEYCDCPAQHHENADKILHLPKQPIQPASVEMQFTSISETQAAQYAISEVQAALKCRLPGCNKPCSIESSGHVYDFCSKNHAIAYNNTQKEEKQAINDPSTSAISSIGLPMVNASVITQTLSSLAKICTKCGKKPANSGKELCQDCYIHS